MKFKSFLKSIALAGLLAVGALSVAPNDANAWGWNSGPSWSYNQGQQQGYATTDVNVFPGFSVDHVTQTQAAHPIGAGTAVNTQSSTGWSFSTGMSIHSRYADQFQESAGND